MPAPSSVSLTSHALLNALFSSSAINETSASGFPATFPIVLGRVGLPSAPTVLFWTSRFLTAGLFANRIGLAKTIRSMSMEPVSARPATHRVIGGLKSVPPSVAGSRLEIAVDSASVCPATGEFLRASACLSVVPAESMSTGSVSAGDPAAALTPPFLVPLASPLTL